MSSSLTTARPYANAIFAIAQKSDHLSAWSETLTCFADLLKDPILKHVILDPRVPDTELVQLIAESLSEALDRSVDQASMEYNFITLLVSVKRLQTVPAISYLYHQLLLSSQKTVEVEVQSAFPLSTQQKDQIQSMLAKRFHSNIQLSTQENASLMGGLLIRAGNWVMDASVKGQLSKLSEHLMG